MWHQSFTAENRQEQALSAQDGSTWPPGWSGLEQPGGDDMERWEGGEGRGETASGAPGRCMLRTWRSRHPHAPGGLYMIRVATMPFCHVVLGDCRGNQEK